MRNLLGKEIDLMVNYPRSKRDVKERGAAKTEEDRRVAQQFGRDFFEGDRKVGYGGFNYHARFWQPVVPTFKGYYHLNGRSSLLDVGCAKGFMMHDFAELVPGIALKGVDISEYAIANAMPDMKAHVQVANATALPFPDRSFDLVISITTVHNLDREDCAKALREIMRVSRKQAFITVDAYRDDDEKERMYSWNLTAKTIMHVDDWKEFFREVGYTGDYYWFIP